MAIWAALNQSKQRLSRANPTRSTTWQLPHRLPPSWDNLVITTDLNGTGSVRVLDAAHRFGTAHGREPRVLLCSTAEMFGHPAHSPQNELTPIEPVSPYGAVKAFAHRMAQVSAAMDSLCRP